MTLLHGVTGIAGGARCLGGLWRFLIARSSDRTSVSLERERNRATADVLPLVPPGCELLEYELHGRLRVIRKVLPIPPGQGGTSAAGGVLEP